MTGILMMSVGNSYGYKPINTVAPAITGTVQVGQTLSCSTGTWDAAPASISYTYQWQLSGSNIGGATSSTYVIQAGDVGGTLRCVVTATNAVGATSANSNTTITVPAVTGQAAYTTPGTYSWVAPAGVTSVSVVAVGAGLGGRTSGSDSTGDPGEGAALGWKNNISVTPGSSYTVVVGAGGTAAIGATPRGASGDTYFSSTGVLSIGGTATNGSAGAITRDGGGSRGTANVAPGGAGGYTGAGGAGGSFSSPNSGNGFTGTGGSGGGGGGKNTNAGPAGNSGGVGLLGEGSNGAGGTVNGGAGGAGSGGSGTSYGGGGRPEARNSSNTVIATAEAGGGGAVRIIWPGTTRSFPATNTGNL